MKHFQGAKKQLKFNAIFRLFIGMTLIFIAQSVFAQSDQDIAQQINNPLTSMTIVPILTDFDGDIGPTDDGDRVTVNLQPITSFLLNEDWTVISRTILPFIDQSDIFPGAGSQSGIGDVVQSLFFSPKQMTESGWTWGVGPVLLLPTATDDLLGTEKWGAGPTAVAVKVTGPWTYGMLVNHIVSFAGNDSRDDVSASLLLPFLDYTTEKAVTYEIISEPVYNWESEQWSVPVTASINKYLQLGGQHLQIGTGLTYWAESADSDPEGLSFTLSLYLLFPK